MKKEDYVIPDEVWLINEFSEIPFGIMRPAEIEVILSFFLIYHNGNDIEAGEGELAVKYRISEAKAKKLKIEFAQRYGNGEAKVTGIIAAAFEHGEIPFELSENEKDVYFIIKDPYELKLIKEDLVEKRIVYQGDFNGKLIKLSISNYIRYMSFYYNDVKKMLNKQITEELDRQARDNKTYWESLSLGRKAELYKPKVIEGVLSLISVGTSIISVLR
jgi:hypothetical protein